jgi:hypothetical protein
MHNKSTETVRTERPPAPASEEDQCHRQGHVQVRVAAAEERRFHVESPFRVVVPEANGADPWDQTEPVGKQDEDEHRGEEPERALRQIAPDDLFEEIPQSLDEELPEILRSTRNFQCGFFRRANSAGRQLSKKDDQARDDPGHDHGVADNPGLPERRGTLRQSVFGVFPLLRIVSARFRFLLDLSVTGIRGATHQGQGAK